MAEYIEEIQNMYFTLKYVAGYDKRSNEPGERYAAGRPESSPEVTSLYNEIYTILRARPPELYLQLERGRLESKLFGDCDSHGPLLSSEQKHGPYQQFPF